MTGTVLENLSGRKIAILVTFLLLCQVVCFLIGGLIAPKPSITEQILASKCVDTTNGTEEWFYIRGPKPCTAIDLAHVQQSQPSFVNQIVFVFQLPLPRDNVILDYSRWQQSLVGILYLEMIHHSEHEIAPRTILTIDAKLGYRNKQDPPDRWTYYASSEEQRNLDCELDNSEGHPYRCNILPLFELGSLHHDFYLLNVRLPVDNGKNANLAHVMDMWLFAINQTGGFTKVWLSLKCIFFPAVVLSLVWFWRRIHLLKRKPQVLETMLIVVALSLTLLNLPIELISLFYDLPFMLLLTDIRQGIFYAALLSFWLVFSVEHLMIKDVPKKSLKEYWPYFSSVAVGCFSLFMFELCERGIQLRNPFYSIWVTDAGTKLATGLLIIGGLCGLGYLLLLCYLIWKVFRNIGAKRSCLPAMSQARKLHYTGVIYRFNFLMIATLVCATLTMVTFSLGQVSEGQFMWEESNGLEYTSAFFTGVYGMWNIYIFALLVLYAPSHKHWPSQSDISCLPVNEFEFSCLEPEPSEISSLTTFVKKSALD